MGVARGTVLGLQRASGPASSRRHRWRRSCPRGGVCHHHAGQYPTGDRGGCPQTCPGPALSRGRRSGRCLMPGYVGTVTKMPDHDVVVLLLPLLIIGSGRGYLMAAGILVTAYTSTFAVSQPLGGAWSGRVDRSRAGVGAGSVSATGPEHRPTGREPPVARVGGVVASAVASGEAI